MELYEIVHWTTFNYHDHLCYTTAKPSVITATMDKDIAEKMLEVYKHNQSADEAYEIRTLRISEPVKL